MRARRQGQWSSTIGGRWRIHDVVARELEDNLGTLGDAAIGLVAAGKASVSASTAGV